MVFVDVETTGSAPPKATLTEFAVVRVEPDDRGGVQVSEFSTLLNPQQPIPAEIQALTGITPAMVSHAPTFTQMAPLIQVWLRDAIFVAHHARFDFGFVKAGFAQAGIDWHAKTLCTVRMSRLLDPDRSPHGLDALIDRYQLSVHARHRALGDAKLLWQLWQAWLRRKGSDVVLATAKLLLREPSLPEHLPPQSLKEIPHAPGIYRFFGLNEHPLYIGKSIDLRTRVASHFVMDHRSERGMRLAHEVRRITWEQTAGENTARILEQLAVAYEMPAHNKALRKSAAAFVAIGPQGIKTTDTVPDLEAPESSIQWFGPFSSKAAARRTLKEAAHDAQACAASLGLERHIAGTPCFSRQLGKCLGACVGAQTRAEQLQLMASALQRHRYTPWPFGSEAAVFEETPSQAGCLHRFVIERWIVLGFETLNGWHAFKSPIFISGIYRLLTSQPLQPCPPIRLKGLMSAPARTNDEQ
jgi:DNA polymerase-3 subunit epsilon